ncbi:hypothetical protein V6N11_068817 [Hibiscus sabdariffa]|uniref:Cytochrome P450 n=1 Tax=Hibiscus sabdariffa TaxID=183260 RepID=A0ABR2PB84_9ROSI
MLGKLLHQSLHRLAQRYGPIISIKLGHVSTIVVLSPEAAELFLKVRDVVFASRPKVQSSDYLTFGTKGLAFTEYGSYWHTIRKWCILHIFSSSKLKNFAPVRKAEIEP